MKKLNLLSTMLLASLISCHAHAANTCSVLGAHEPNTNVYDGPTWCEYVNLDSIIVRGPFSANHTKVLGKTDISGPVQSGDSQFQDVIIHSSLSRTKVILSQNTTVNGDLVFEGVKGRVYIDKTSKVTGKIVNAEIHQVG